MSCYYYGGKAYNTETATVLCKHSVLECEEETLYQTKKGAFFLIKNDGILGQGFKVLSEKDARKFMDDHPEGIDTEAYDRIFGAPEEA